MVMCFAPSCKHYSERDGCKFFTFPKEPKELSRWLKLIRRKDKNPSKHSRICSCHFENQDRSNGPTIFDYNVGKRFNFEDTEKTRKRVKQSGDSYDPGEGTSGLQEFSQIEEENTEPQDVAQHNLAAMEVVEPSVAALNVEQSDNTTPSTTMKSRAPNFQAMLEADNYYLRQEISKLKGEVERLKSTFTFTQIADNDHLISVYTGIQNKVIFELLFSLFESLDLKYYNGWQVQKISKIDQLLLTLMKLKMNLLNDDLALRFNISRETVSNIFKTWIFALHEILFQQFMKTMPSRSKNKLCMPACFSTFSNCRVVIDCTEMSTIHPKNMEKQRVTYSSYKHRNTLKALIGVAPNGVVTFASKLYPGSTSDKKITKHCGIMNLLQTGDLILADKGFLISELLPEGVSLNIPPFLSTPQFTPEQVIQTRTIAKARIHVERAIRRIKAYTILSNIPSSLIPLSSVVFQVCTALTNLEYPLIKEVQLLFDY